MGGAYPDVGVAFVKGAFSFRRHVGVNLISIKFGNKELERARL
jgi:hypothetical protein